MVSKRTSVAVGSGAAARAEVSGRLSARDGRILDAVRETAIRTGSARATVQEIADAAAVSRMTFYRAMGSYESALLLALTREFQVGTEQILNSTATSSGRDRLLEFLDSVIRAFAESAFIAVVRKTNPEILMPYLAERLGRGQETVLDIINRLLSDGERDGSIRATADTGITILLAVHGIALGAQILRRSGDFDGALDEFRRMIAAGLGPTPER